MLGCNTEAQLFSLWKIQTGFRPLPEWLKKQNIELFVMPAHADIQILHVRFR